MKYNKLLLLAAVCLPLFFTSCSKDKENMNSGNATVSFTSSLDSVKESKSMLQIPVKVSGTHDGLILANIKISESNNGSGSFKNDSSLILTTKQIRIPAGVDSVNVELALDVFNQPIVKGRYFVVTLESVEGATVGTNPSVRYNVREENPLAGTWTFAATNGDGTAETFPVVLSESDKDATLLVCTGFMNYNWVVWHLSAPDETNVSVIANEVIAADVNFTSAHYDVRFVTGTKGAQQIGYDNLAGKVNATKKLITFDADKTLYGGLFNVGTSTFAGYVWFQYSNCTMSRK